MKSVKSHLQPKFFLKGFNAKKVDASHDDFIYVYKKGMPFKSDGTRQENNPSKCGLHNVAFVKNFYSFLKDDGTEDPETYENRLSIEIENPGNPVLEKLRSIELARNEAIKMSDFLTDHERYRLARYIGAMCSRVQRSRRQFAEAVENTIKNAETIGFSFAELMQNIPATERQKLENYARSIDSRFDARTGRLLMPPKLLKNFESKTLQDETFPKSIFRHIDLLEAVFLKMKWQLRFTPPLMKLFTGDDPIYWTNLNEPNAVLLFPISTTAIFVASRDSRIYDGIFLDKDEKFFEDVRVRLAGQCRELYYSCESKWLVDYFNKL